MPAYQQSLGTVNGSSGTPCASTGGDSREVPDVSADADPSSGYIIYDHGRRTNRLDCAGRDRRVRHRSGRLSSPWPHPPTEDTTGYGALEPNALSAGPQTPGTYLNDVTSGNIDYNATAGGQYPAMTGYDMATGLGTPVVSELASGLTAIALDVVVSVSQTYGSQSPSVTASADYAGSGTTPLGVTLDTSSPGCHPGGQKTTPISPTLPAGSHTLGTIPSCGGATLSGPVQPTTSSSTPVRRVTSRSMPPP